MTLVILIFILTYVGMAVGRVPGLRIDRSGIALIAVSALLISGSIETSSIAKAVDAPTIILLFALMIISAQFLQAGFYERCAVRITHSAAGPRALLAATVITAGGLSAVLANDIVVFAMTPLLCRGLSGRGLDPRPYLIGLAGASNAGSAATLIGNPQNILIGQIGGLDFWTFLGICGLPAAGALGVVYFVVARVWREELAPQPTEAGPASTPPVDSIQIAKGAIAVVAVIMMFASPLPKEVGALAIAALLLASRRMASREMVGAVDWHLLLLIACLFVVTAAFADTGMAASALDWLEARELLPTSLAILAPLALCLSNTVGNVPAVILLTTVMPDAAPGVLYGLALLATLAGNFLIVGSLANIIVAERAQLSGVRLGFADFARAGIPMTLASMAMAVAWLALGGWMPLY